MSWWMGWVNLSVEIINEQTMQSVRALKISFKISLHYSGIVPQTVNTDFCHKRKIIFCGCGVCYAYSFPIIIFFV